MTKGPILDPLRQIKTNDLQVTSASIIEGATLQQGQTTTIAVSILLARSVECLATRFRVYDTEGRCAFASGLKNNGTLAQGHHRVDFYFVAGLPAGQYVASFEFQDKVPSDTENFDAKNILALHSLYVEFSIKTNNHDDSQIEGDCNFGYTSIPVEIMISSQKGADLAQQIEPAIAATPRFPWPLAETQFNLEELANVLQGVLNPSAPQLITTKGNQLTLLSPTTYECEYVASKPPIHTQVGVVDGVNLSTSKKAGYLLFGPYISAMPGSYRLTLKGSVGLAGAQDIKIDVAAKRGTVILAAISLQSLSAGPLDVSLDFNVLYPGYVDLEFRLKVSATDELTIEKLIINTALDKHNASSLDVIKNRFLRSNKECDFQPIQIESILEKVYSKILGTTPSRSELKNLVESFASQNEDIDFILEKLMRDDRSWTESIRNNAGKVVNAVYSSLLQREPEFDTVTLKKNIDLSNLFKSILNSGEFEALAIAKARLKKFELVGRSTGENAKLEIDGSCILVHTLKGGAFLYYALACCRQIRSEYKNKKIYLISDVDLRAEVHESIFDALHINGLYQTKDLLHKELGMDLNPGLIVANSEGTIDNVADLIKSYPQALFGVWADGFRNVANKIRWSTHAKVRKIYYFGFKNYLAATDFTIETIIPLSFVWDSQKTILENRWGQALNVDVKNYSVFYPRYWWRSPYKFKHEFIVSSWLATVLENSPADELIVIKSSSVYWDGANVISDFRAKLEAHGRSVCFIEDFCALLGIDKKMANLPSEDLLYLGVLSNAKSHYVLDSSLATIVATHPNVQKPLQIVLGSKMSIENESGFATFINNLGGQMEGLMKCTNFSLVNQVSLSGGNFPAIVRIN